MAGRGIVPPPKDLNARGRGPSDTIPGVKKCSINDLMARGSGLGETGQRVTETLGLKKSDPMVTRGRGLGESRPAGSSGKFGLKKSDQMAARGRGLGESRPAGSSGTLGLKKSDQMVVRGRGLGEISPGSSWSLGSKKGSKNSINDDADPMAHKRNRQETSSGLNATLGSKKGGKFSLVDEAVEGGQIGQVQGETNLRMSGPGSFGGGHGGSSSHVGAGDPMADMEGVFRNHQQRGSSELDGYEDYEGNNDGPTDDEDSSHKLETRSRPSHGGSNTAPNPHHSSHRISVTRVGKKFGNFKVHKLITKILEGNLEGPWLTYRDVPREVKSKMFEEFRSVGSWDPSEDFAIRQGMDNVLKDRYRDMMLEQREESARKAIKFGHFIPPNMHCYDIQKDFPGSLWHIDIWRQLCELWGSDEWAKKSKRGKSNRNKPDSAGFISRHTGGSIGYDEHRIRLQKKKKKGEIVTMNEVFLMTHLTKESKKKFVDGLYNDENPEEMEFCIGRSHEIYDQYTEGMLAKYGPELNNHPAGDVDVWNSSAGPGRETYGIGSSDPHFIVTGASSSSSRSGLSQDERNEFVSEIQDLRSIIEAEQKKTQDLERKMERLDKYLSQRDKDSDNRPS